MTKVEFVNKVATKLDMSAKSVTTVLNAILEQIVEDVANKETVQFSGFGSFDARQHAARTGHDPQDPSKKIEIPAKTAPHFKAGTRFKEAVNK